MAKPSANQGNTLPSRNDGRYQEIDVARLHLDPENPRHHPVDNEPEIIAALFDTESVAALARDIAQRSAISPLDIIGVVEMPGNPGHFVTMEGNRRTCALILLSDPYRSPTAAIRQQVLEYSKLGNVPDRVLAFVFNSSSVALPWVDLRHMGEQGGVGTKPWNANQQANALTRRTGGAPRPAKAAATQNLLAQAVLQRLVDLKAITPEQLSAISLTTIARYLTSPEVRLLLGLGDHRVLNFTHEPAEVDSALTRLVLDSLPGPKGEKPKVTSRSDRTERLNYVRLLAQEGVTPSVRLDVPVEPPAVTVSTKRSVRRSKPDPHNQRRLLTTAFTVESDDKVLGQLRQEMLKLDIEHHEFACNYLLRAFVERILVRYLRTHGRMHGSEHLTDRELQKRAAALLQLHRSSAAIYTVVNNAASNDATPHGLLALGAAVHGSVIPTKRALLTHMFTWAPVLQFMLEASIATERLKK